MVPWWPAKARATRCTTRPKATSWCELPRPAAPVHAAVQSADAAFDAWSQTPPKDRAALLLKLAERIDAQAHVFARLEADNCGKPFNAVLLDELPAVSDVFRFFAGAVRCLQGSAAGEYVAGIPR